MRVLLIGDGGAPTGFERVTRAIGNALHAAGHTVIHRAIGYDPRRPTHVDYPYALKPLWATADDPFGVTKVPRWLKEDVPDVVVLVQDLWNQVNYLAYLPPHIPTVGYFPVDAPNLKWQYGLALGRLTKAIPYTEFGAHEAALSARAAVNMLARVNPTELDTQTHRLVMTHEEMQLHMVPSLLGRRQNPSEYRPIPHGLDRNKFYPVSKSQARQAFGFPEDAFIVLNVNTNQFRKRLDITIRGFAELAKWNEKALLVIHSSSGDAGGWDLNELAQVYDLTDRVICVHHTKRHLTDEELNILYNTADVQVNTGGGEGWGLNSFEGALCGVPQMVPDWSATRELWREDGILLSVSDYRFPEKWATTAHACVDAEAYGRRLVELSRNPKMLADFGQKAQEFANRQPSWDEVGRRFVDAVEEAAQTPIYTAFSIRELLAMRTGPLESDLKSLFRR